MTTPLTPEEIVSALDLVEFLDLRYGEDIAVLPTDSPGGREALGHRLIVQQARLDLVSPHTVDQHLLRLRAVHTLRDLSIRWAGSHDGAGRHPAYRAEWLPPSYST